MQKTIDFRNTLFEAEENINLLEPVKEQLSFNFLLKFILDIMDQGELLYAQCNS